MTAATPVDMGIIGQLVLGYRPHLNYYYYYYHCKICKTHKFKQARVRDVNYSNNNHTIIIIIIIIIWVDLGQYWVQ